MAGPDMRYEEYIASNIWRCKKSPTGAHYWMDKHRVGERGYNTFTCIFCNHKRRFFDRLNGRGEKV